MIVEQFLINKAKEIDNPISNWGIGFTAEVIREWVELQGLVKMNIKKVLQDYISYHWIEEFITDEQKDAMLKNLGVYIKGMIPQLTIHSASESFNCIASNGYDGFMNKCEEQCDMCKSGFNLKD